MKPLTFIDEPYAGESPPRPLIIYHAHCNDGFAAAWVAWRYFAGLADFHAASYGSADKKEPPPDVRGRHIFILDFSYPRGDLLDLASRNRHVFVLDHHRSAALALALLPEVPSVAEWEAGKDKGFALPLAATFDMARSGAGLAWDWFFPGLSRPALVRHVEDRDLWRFDYPETRAVHSALSSYPMDFETWDRLAVQMAGPRGFEALIAEGVTLDRMHLKRCHEIIEQASRTVQLAGYTVPICAAPYAFASDIGNILSNGQPFAATYVEHAGGTTFSLRSQKDGGVDVSAIAEVWGGGGHRNAAGFTISGAQGVAGVATVPQDEQTPTRPA